MKLILLNRLEMMLLTQCCFSGHLSLLLFTRTTNTSTKIEMQAFGLLSVMLERRLDDRDHNY
ncbi:hypothetical protein Sjap_015640 [Stephania japonica]|uniref:Uncharacterized protein n=1 Tax=Stephania japonica TaxID=461633 RepID=A0AAP0NRJ8_9MAGN